MTNPLHEFTPILSGEPPSEEELFPVVMVYLTIKLDHSRGWSNAVRVQTPDGANVLRSWGRSGGSLSHGLAKTIDDLTTAYQMGARIGPFDDLPLGTLQGDPTS